MPGFVEVFWRFLLLGCVSFGGPAAHIGYFQQAFVQRLRWLDDAAYARLVALSQFLPGPSSSQVGFAIGYRRAGLPGAVAAFLGFTLPSFLLMFAVAVLSAQVAGSGGLEGLVRGLKLLAVVVVAEAVRTMALSFCRDAVTTAIAVLTAALLLLAAAPWAQYVALLLAALAGLVLLPRLDTGAASQAQARTGIRWLPLGLFTLLFVGLPLYACGDPVWRLFSQFYSSGSMVFGGGHVVLPLLQQHLGDAVSEDRFLLGYAAAQAMPGPMFSLAAFLGADLLPAAPFSGALLATAGIFLPGFLLVLALQSAWEALAARPRVMGLVAGVNASVVGLLLAAWVNPVALAAINGWLDAVLAVAGWFLLFRWRPPILALVAGFAAVGVVLNV
ncbi:chromate efflux transporter [Haliea sp. E1-2-M8]|uniref:chromate efflux transporter n=1 Tax=Haliea sp. E1-2-M8 TaxID=3064706 RepID=UPI00271F9DBD|nr:chromate efflux transporter [Haliea sp. E1-2-M8]MDO8860569.1 chromate efflux transporter [Haliea sp. E1-2-M8]